MKFPYLCKRKSYITLLETLIAFSLLSVLLVFVFGFFRELSEITQMTDHAQKESFQMRYLESRLGFIFERVVNENKSGRNFFFYTEPPSREISSSQSLILTFSNGVRLDPTYSGDVLGRLYVGPDRRLRLAVWPLLVEDPHAYMQEEILFENVVDISYKFYSPPEKATKGTDITTKKTIDPDKKMPEKDEWLPEWFETYKQMPAIVEINVKVDAPPPPGKRVNDSDKGKTRDYTFKFVLPSYQNYIHYPAGDLNS